MPFADAVKYVNELELVEVNIAPKPKKTNILDVIEDVAEVAASVSPIIAVAKTVAKATKKKGK